MTDHAYKHRRALIDSVLPWYERALRKLMETLTEVGE